MQTEPGMPKDPPEKSPKGVFQNSEARALLRIRESREASRETSGEIMVPTRAPIDRDDEPTPPPHSIARTVDLLWSDTRDDVKELQAIAFAHGGRLIALSGEDGKNGAVGSATKRLDKYDSRIWWAVTFIIGAIGTAAIKLIVVVRAFDALDSQAQHNAEKILLLQAESTRLEAQILTLQQALLMRPRRAVDPVDPGDRIGP